jgi:hypothetical protein
MRVRLLLVLLLILSFTGFNFAVKTVELTNPEKFARKLTRNNVFLKFCDFFDAAGDFYYFLDRHFSVVFKVKRDTGELVQTISSKGQGPKELQDPVNMRLQNSKIFILDRGFNGVKIFDTTGNMINEFKLDFVVGERSIDVNGKEEIFLGRADCKTNSMVQVFDINGKRLRALIPLKEIKGVAKLDKTWYYTIRLDKDENIYVLYYMDRKLEKYDKEGKLLWEKPIKNKLLDQYPDDTKVKGGSSGQVHTNNQRVFGIDVTPKGNVIVAHTGGGCVFAGDGELISLITTPNEEWTLFQFKIFKDKLMNVTKFGQIVYIYHYKEE